MMMNKIEDNRDALLPSSLVPFTLVELMVVISIILLLASLLMPTLNRSRQSAQSTYCQNNLKHLMMDNSMYLSTWESYVAWGCDKTTTNLVRWHGVRSVVSNSAPYDPAAGPLNPYINSKNTPACPYLSQRLDPKHPSVERGGGGYGYNIFVGTRRYFVDDPDSEDAYKSGIKASHLSHSDTVVFFADSAMNVTPSGSVQSNSSSGELAEYSVCNSPFGVSNREMDPNLEKEPSIHFRHSRMANVAWGDGHVNTEILEWTWDIRWDAKSLGFIGSTSNNALFSPK